MAPEYIFDYIIAVQIKFVIELRVVFFALLEELL